MRVEARIPLFLEKIDLEKVLKIYFPEFKGEIIQELKDKIVPKMKTIEKYWYENTDQRFSQVLINTGSLPNIPGMWYYEEDEDVLHKMGLPIREILFWGVNFTKDMVRLPETKWRLIKDLETDHIKAILDGKFTKNPTYLEAFTDELKLRENG